MIPPRLLLAYRLTRYQADGNAIQIGRRVPDALFARLGKRQAVLVTAWNPMSRRMPEGWNCRMQRRLRQRLRQFTVLHAEGSLRRWREAMLLVAAPPQRLILEAMRFRQRGIVVLRRGHQAQLRILSSPTDR